MAEANLLGKRNPEDDLETKQILKKHKEKSEEKETTTGFADQYKSFSPKSHANIVGCYIQTVATRKKTLYVGHLSCDTEISHIIDFFKDVGEVIHVRLVVNLKGKHLGYAFVEFASSNEAKKALQNKNGEHLHDRKILLGVAWKDPYFPRSKNDKVWYKDDYVIEEGLDETPYFVKGSAIGKKTLYVTHLSPQTEISDIIDFFKNVGEVVRVQLTVNNKCEPTCCGFVEFASVNEAKKALDDSKIFVVVANNNKDRRPQFCIDHKVWSGDYLGQESLPMEEDETPFDFVEDVLFVANLSPQTKILHIINCFKYYGVVSVRLIVNHEGKHVGYGFVQFVSSYQAKKALQNKNGGYLQDHKIFLDVAKTAPYPLRPNCNLADMLCYEDYLRRESLVIEDDETVEGIDETPDFVAVRKKTLFVSHLSPQTEISHIINFFKDVGEVVHVRLIVDQNGKHVGYGFVEFASSNEAKKALEMKKGEYLHDCKIVLDLPKTAPNPPGPEYCIDHKVWYEDYLGRESLLIEEDEAVDGLDETPDLVKEVAVRKKTLFVDNLNYHNRFSNIISFFRDVGKVCRVRLIVNHMGKYVGCGFVEFASANEAKKALQKKNGEKLCGHKIFLDVAEIAPYPLRPKYNLAEMLWYKDYLQQEGLLIEEDDSKTKPNLKKQEVPIFCGKKIIFSDDDD